MKLSIVACRALAFWYYLNEEKDGEEDDSK